jgi:predicted dithiol-disulfide oxidoreductase (DUF899 family)
MNRLRVVPEAEWHLHARDVSLVPWFTTTDDFSEDFDVPEYFGLNVFLRDGEEVSRTYLTNGRAAEAIGPVWSFLDLTPLGRQETWEDSPEGYPQDPPYSWWRLHEEYDGLKPDD